MSRIPITVAYGDGIGPEIMRATLKILQAARAPIDPIVVDIGEKAYLSGADSGIPKSAWDTIYKTKIILKAPITTPQGGGYKSLNVTLRKALGLYANVRPCKALSPCIPTQYTGMDLVIIRENEEDLYAGISYRQTENVYQDLKLISRPGCEKVIRYAFEYARHYQRKKVTAITKDNIMKMTDGLFHKVFNEIAKEYSDIQNEHLITDIATALVATKPERFDVIVTENLYGDIISDVAAQVVGSVGLAGSANIGIHAAMFEAIHGSAPDIAGQNKANPSGLINAAILMLLHLNQPKIAELIENAWLRALEDGVHTGDIYCVGTTEVQVSTDEFADAVIARLGQAPVRLDKANYPSNTQIQLPKVIKKADKASQKLLVGIDIYLDSQETDPTVLAGKLMQEPKELFLQSLANRGLKVWPEGLPDVYCSEHWRCRFLGDASLNSIDYQRVLTLLQQLYAEGWHIIKTENLYTFDGEKGFSLAQGE
ncbi:MAG: NADP-dependent isocitrate dehydrogenase [Proteobacteria bacterium]|nr:NADP-dependent isocitrate dehydrogenase [Pseudomonadota bacterium]